MSRENKFRGLTKDGKWVYGNLITAIYKGGWVTAIQEELDDDNISIYESLSIHVIFDSRTICQYTGVTDMNGVKVYEGDIIEYHSDIINTFYKINKINRVVEYKYGMYGIEGIEKGTHIPFANILKYKYKVIGNIYQNSDLLEDN